MRSRKINERGICACIFPSRPNEIFEVDGRCETDGAILGCLEDEGEQMGEEAGLERECLKPLFCLLPSSGVERCKEEVGELSHGRGEGDNRQKQAETEQPPTRSRDASGESRYAP